MVRPANAGFTLIEVIAAMVILAGVALSLGMASGELLRTGTTNRIAAQASAAAVAHLSLAQVWPEYSTIDSAFAGTAANTPFPGYTRVTTVTRFGGPSATTDFKRVTVTITGPGLAAPIRQSVTVADDRL